MHIWSRVTRTQEFDIQVTLNLSKLFTNNLLFNKSLKSKICVYKGRWFRLQNLLVLLLGYFKSTGIVTNMTKYIYFSSDIYLYNSLV